MRILRTLLLAITAGGILSAATITNITSVTDLNTLNGQIAGLAKKNYGFMTGSGNITPANTTEFFGLKIGLGLGIAGNAGFMSLISAPNSITSIDTLVSLIPAPYDVLYAKIGLPGFIPFLDKTDVGVRFGYFPTMSIPLSGGFMFNVNGVSAFGIEVRKTFFELPAGLIRVDARVAYNYSGGGIGIKYTTNAAGVTNTFTETMTWSGNNISVKAVAGVNIPFVFGAFVGIGPELNFGGVTAQSDLTAQGSFNFAGTTFSALSTITSSALGAYDPFDIRVIGGIHLLVVDVAVEYGLLSGGLSAYAGLSLAF
ncbi:MAG: hypothetical protein AABZ39_01140 [Spirochaetota bacterium]